MTKGIAAAFLAMALLAGVTLPARALDEHAYRLKGRNLHAVTVSSATEIEHLRDKKATAVIEIWGQVSGILASSDGKVLMVRLPDDQSVELRSAYLPSEIQSGVKIKALVRGSASAGISSFKVEAIAIDNGRHFNVPTSSSAVTTATALPMGPRVSLPSRSADEITLTCMRAIAYFNPKLPVKDIDQIANSIVKFSNSEGVDPYFIVAVVAAESRFRPTACSYKGAMGLGQLMPGTARGLGVSDPFDPVQNLAGAIRLLRGHLQNYSGQPYQAALALAAYNAGSGAVRKHGGVPPYRETQNYIWKVYEYYCWMHGVQPEARPRH